MGSGTFHFYWAEGGVDGSMANVSVDAKDREEAKAIVVGLAGREIPVDQYVGDGVTVKSVTLPTDPEKIIYSGRTD